VAAAAMSAGDVGMHMALVALARAGALMDLL
jgi:hypothetical protein